jgi:hypothetical protein
MDLTLEQTQITEEPAPSAQRNFRKKPVVIEAEQFILPDLPSGVVPVWISLADPHKPIVVLERGDLKYGGNHVVEGFGIHTLEGWHIATPGDWIITGVKGEKYPCKPDVFEMTYEPVYDVTPEFDRTEDSEC